MRQHSMKLPALPEGAGGAPALLYPVDAKQAGAKMHGIMHGIMQEVQSGRFRIIPAKPLYYFAGYTQSWYRVLMLENGHYLRIQLTPLNPTVQNEWAKMLGENLDLIQWCTSSLDGNDRSWSVSKNRYTQVLSAEVMRHMHYHLGSPRAERLLTGDIWAEIEPLWPIDYESSYDVSDWLGRCGYNGGIPLVRIQKNPPTRAELYAAEDKKRKEEHESRQQWALKIR